MVTPDPFASDSSMNPASKSPPGASGHRRWPTVLLILAVAGLLAWGGYRLATGTAAGQASRSPSGHGGFRGGGPGGQASPVGAASVVTADIRVVINGLGTVTPLRTVTVSAQVAGQLQSVDFREGQHVRKGDVLATIDPRSFQAALAQAQGSLARDQAQLGNAKVDLLRYQTLFKQDSTSRQQLDTQAALVHQYEGAVAADLGAVEVAKVNLGYTRVLAPVDGRAGLRQVDPGNNVGNGSAIVVITQMRPMDVLFTLPEDNLPTLRARMRAGAAMTVEAWDRAGTKRLAAGTLASVDNQIDTSTGTVKVKAEFQNDDESLFPNQFVNVKLMLDTLHDATVIPASALQRGANGLFVYVIGDDDTVSVRNVKTAVSEGDRVQVIEGLKPGERVVTDGSDRLREGSKVTIPTLPGGGAASSLVDTLPSPASDAGSGQRNGGHHRGNWGSGRRDGGWRNSGKSDQASGSGRSDGG